MSRTLTAFAVTATLGAMTLTSACQKPAANSAEPAVTAAAATLSDADAAAAADAADAAEAA